MRTITTKYVTMDPRRCAACWECVEKCPKNIIGKAGFLWHKHVIFENADACIGCNKCIKTCPHGVFCKTDEAALSGHLRSVGRRSPARRLLPWAFGASVVTGFGLHIAGHGSSHSVWENWAAAHVAASTAWFIAAAFHIGRHKLWYKRLVSERTGTKSLLTLFLTLAFLAVTVTGLVLITCIDGAESATGLWHYKAGILLAVLSLIHCVGRRHKG